MPYTYSDNVLISVHCWAPLSHYTMYVQMCTHKQVSHKITLTTSVSLKLQTLSHLNQCYRKPENTNVLVYFQLSVRCSNSKLPRGLFTTFQCMALLKIRFMVMGIPPPFREYILKATIQIYITCLSPPT